ncbi:MAG: hypothetical protein WCX82_03100 [archaeon]|jgi:hypothetical protein
MESKGLFELMFMLVMLVLLLPATTQTTHIVTSTVETQVNTLALLSDYAISDALADQAAVDCNIDLPDIQVNPYLTTLLTEFNKTSGANCSVLNSGAIVGANDYNGTIDIACSSRSNSNETNIIKRLAYNKQINTNKDTNLYSCEEKCAISIKDNYQSEYIPAAYNFTETIADCTPSSPITNLFEDNFDNLSTDWSISNLYSAIIVSGKLETTAFIDTWEDTGYAATYDFATPLQENFEIVANLTWDGNGVAQHLLQIQDQNGNFIYVGLVDDNATDENITLISSLNGADVSANDPLPVNISTTGVRLIIRSYNQSNPLFSPMIDIEIAASDSSSSYYTNSRNYVMTGISQIALINTTDSTGNGKIAKWDYVKVTG